MKTLLRAVLIAAAASAACAHAAPGAAPIVVTPDDLGPGLGRWNTANVRTGSSAAITDGNARNGNGSAGMSLADGNGKADFALTWGYVANRTLGNLDALSYDWYRSAGGGAPAHLQPALRLVYDTDGDAGTPYDRGYLVWELEYNGRGVVDNTWTSSDTIGGNFWMRQFNPPGTPGNTVEHYNTTLAEWMSADRPGAPADELNANTAILGIEFGIGSGWNGSFSGFVDNVRVGFGTDTQAYNFESTASDVPEPGSFALLGLGLVGVLAARKRKRA